MNFNEHLEELFEYIHENWNWTAADYPILNILKDEDQILHFQDQHILLHLQKQLGKLVVLTEAADHGEYPSDFRAQQTEAVARLLLNSLEFCRLNQIPPQQLIDRLATFYDKPKNT